MAFKDILVALNSYPDPTPVSVVDDAVSIAAALGAHIAALSCETSVQVPGHFISNKLIDGVIAEETSKSRKNARELLAAFDAAAEKSGITHEALLEKCLTLEIPDMLVEYARLRDLTILSIPASNDQWFAEALIFGSGKPTLILPESPNPPGRSNWERLRWPGISAVRLPGRYPMRCRFWNWRERCGS